MELTAHHSTSKAINIHCLNVMKKTSNFTHSYSMNPAQLNHFQQISVQVQIDTLIKFN